MGAVGMWVRAELRARWRSWAALAVLVAVGAGAALTAFAGARRTDDAYDLMAARTKAPDVVIQIEDEPTPALLDALAGIDGVEATTTIGFFPADENLEADRASWNLTAIAATDRAFASTILIPHVVDGRLPDPSEPNEVLIAPRFARARGLEVGSELSFRTFRFPEVFAMFAGEEVRATGPVATVRVVGIGWVPRDFALPETDSGTLILTPAFNDTYAGQAAVLTSVLARLRDGEAGVDAFIAGARRIGGVDDILVEREGATVRARITAATGVQSIALAVFALVMAVATLLIVGQALGRQMGAILRDRPALAALGLERSGMFWSAYIPAAVTVAAGVLLSVVLATVVSPVMPIGLARDLAGGGFSFDPVALLGGSAVLGLGLLVVLTVPAWLLARAREGAVRTRPPALPEALARWGMGIATVTGARFATEVRRGRDAVPVRTSLVSVSLALVAVVGVITFAAGFDRLLTTPAAYGWNWDAVVYGADDPRAAQAIADALRDHPAVDGTSVITTRAIASAHGDIPTAGVERIDGDVGFTILEGDAPAADDEVAVATRTMQRLGVTIGDTVPLPGSKAACGGQTCSIPFTVVGRIVYWGEEPDPGVGIALTKQGQDRLDASGGFSDFAVRFTAGVDREAVTAELAERFGDAESPTLPTIVANATRVASVPYVLAIVLGLLALATMIHAVVTAVRRRRSDLAVLKVLGARRRDVRATVRWHASILVGLTSIVALPAGIALGRWLWIVVAGTIGVEAVAAVPLGALAVLVVALLLAANGLAALPGRSAARTMPAMILRSE